MTQSEKSFGSFSSEKELLNLALNSPPARDCVVNNQHYHCAYNRDEEAVNIETGNRDRAQGIENGAANQRANNAEYHIEYRTLAAVIHDMAGDIACD